MNWGEFRQKAGRSNPPGLLLCLDPGETCGWARFLDGNLVDCGQLPLGKTGQEELFNFIKGAVLGSEGDTTVVCENYKVYEHRKDQHVGSDVVTLQYIGVIKLACSLMSLPLVMQMAWQAKQFQTDDKLKQWGLYQVAMKHANDAIRHGCYYILFGHH